MPSTHVSLKRLPAPNSGPAAVTNPTAPPAPGGSQVYMKAEWDYEAISADELSLRRGDTMVVLGDGPDPGWLLVLIESQGQKSGVGYCL